ncbi:MAG TPA: AsmA family protein, partial [Magnetospirillaceae bacterium]|nr:AsmA family protein [Magnetospirillaceae bacterium]
MSKFKIITAVAALCALMLAAWLAPRFVDQNSLRAWVAPQLQRALHQEVAIDGAIDFAVLPRPMVQVRQISVGRPDHKTADIPEIEATLKLWPLLMGRLEPDQLVLSRPDIHLDGLPPAKPPAALAPPVPSGESAAPAAAPATAAAFKNFTPRDIGRIVIEKGSLSFPGLTLSPVDLKIVTADDSLSLSGRVGAGRAGVQIDGDARWLDGRIQASNLALRVDGGAVLRWTGQGDPLSQEHPLIGKLTGRIEDPALFFGEKAPPVPLALSGDLTFKPGEIDAANLLVTVGDAEFKGDGQFIAGDTPRAGLHLHAATIDLEKMPPAPAKPAPAAPGAVSLPPPPALTTSDQPEPRHSLPLLREASLQLGLSADQILWRGKIMQDAKLEVTSLNGAVTINQAVVTLPGNSQFSLAGVLDEESRFTGSFEARSDDFREVLRWADLDPSRVPADRLRSARLAGHIKGDLD